MIELEITPVGKPRMTQRDRWKKRPAVLQYYAFKDKLRVLMAGRQLPEAGWHMICVLPMPDSWSKKRKREMCGKPHQQKPDKDNLEKAILDTLFEDDSHVWDGRVTKIWGYTGRIIIMECGEPDPILQRIRFHESQARMF